MSWKTDLIAWHRMECEREAEEARRRIAKSRQDYRDTLRNDLSFYTGIVAEGATFEPYPTLEEPEDDIRSVMVYDGVRFAKNHDGRLCIVSESCPRCGRMAYSYTIHSKRDLGAALANPPTLKAHTRYDAENDSELPCGVDTLTAAPADEDDIPFE